MVAERAYGYTPGDIKSDAMLASIMSVKSGSGGFSRHVRPTHQPRIIDERRRTALRLVVWSISEGIGFDAPTSIPLRYAACRLTVVILWRYRKSPSGIFLSEFVLTSMRQILLINGDVLPSIRFAQIALTMPTIPAFCASLSLIPKCFSRACTLSSSFSNVPKSSFTPATRL